MSNICAMLPESLRDPRFHFDEEKHLYTFDGRELQSATSWLKAFEKPFDSDHWARKKAAELGLTPRQVKKMWADKRDSSSDMGTAVHKAIEDYLMHGLPCDSPDPEVQRRFALFLKLWEGRLKGAQPLACELRMYSLRYGLAGTLDLLIRLPNGKLYIGDWKTNEKFTSGDEGFGYLLPPFDGLKDNKLNKYAIQVALYRLLLGEHGVDVSGAFIVHLPPNTTEPVVHFTDDLRLLVKRQLDGKVEEPLW